MDIEAELHLGYAKVHHLIQKTTFSPYFYTLWCEFKRFYIKYQPKSGNNSKGVQSRCQTIATADTTNTSLNFSIISSQRLELCYSFCKASFVNLLWQI